MYHYDKKQTVGDEKYFPEGQLVQALPVPSEYAPTPHAVQDTAPARLYRPFPHATQLPAEEAAEPPEEVPGGHAVHVPCAASEYVPDLQLVQDVAPDRE
jgi:hypothetical protein